MDDANRDVAEPGSAILNVKNQGRGRADLLKRLIKGDFRGGGVSPSCVPNQSQVDGNECEGEDNQKYCFRHDRGNSSSREKSEQEPGIGSSIYTTPGLQSKCGGGRMRR